MGNSYNGKRRERSDGMILTNEGLRRLLYILATYDNGQNLDQFFDSKENLWKLDVLAPMRQQHSCKSLLTMGCVKKMFDASEKLACQNYRINVWNALMNIDVTNLLENKNLKILASCKGHIIKYILNRLQEDDCNR